MKAKRSKKYSIVEREHPTWAQLLEQATTMPGTASTAYSMFHEYSFGNRMLAMWQAAERGLQPGPFGTFNFWLGKHRRVRKGEKAIVLCQPRTVNYAKEDENTGEVEEVRFTKFTYPAHWFFLSQTEGDDYKLPALPAWKLAKALVSLEVTEVPFTVTEGNAMGYAHLREYAINPLDPHPAQTLFHELAHIVLGHTEEVVTDTADRTPRSVREMEAEATAMLVADALELKDHAESRGYIQGWYTEQEIPEASAHRIFHAADVILSAGLPAKSAYKATQAKKPAKRRSTKRVAVAA